MSTFRSVDAGARSPRWLQRGLDGTGAGANNGKVTAKYRNGTGKLTTTGAGNLRPYKVSGCAGLIHSGDGSSFKGSYTVNPHQTITSP